MQACVSLYVQEADRRFGLSTGATLSRAPTCSAQRPTVERSCSPALQDGNYLDRQTRSLSAELLTFSAELRVFGYARLAFSWMADGSVSLKAHFLGLPALTYLHAGNAAGGSAQWSRVASKEFAGLWVVTAVFAAVVIVQAVHTLGFAFSRDLTMSQVRIGPCHRRTHVCGALGKLGILQIVFV